MKLKCIRMEPNRNIQYDKAFSLGNATSLAPMASGTTKLKKATLIGMITMKIITVACIVNIWL